MAAKFTSTAVARGPGRVSRFGNRTGPGRGRARQPAPAGDKAARRRSAARRPARRCEAHCRRNSSRHGRDAGQLDRSGRFVLAAKPRRRGKWRPLAGNRRPRSWPPSMPRSVRRSAPPAQPRRSEEISAAANASENPPLRRCQLIMHGVRSRDEVPGDNGVRRNHRFQLQDPSQGVTAKQPQATSAPCAASHFQSSAPYFLVPEFPCCTLRCSPR